MEKISRGIGVERKESDQIKWDKVGLAYINTGEENNIFHNEKPLEWWLNELPKKNRYFEKI